MAEEAALHCGIKNEGMLEGKDVLHCEGKGSMREDLNENSKREERLEEQIEMLD